VQEVYGVALQAPAREKIDNFARFVDCELLGAVLARTTSGYTVPQLLPAPTASDLLLSTRVDPLGAFSLAASPSLKGPRMPYRGSHIPTQPRPMHDLLPRYPIASAQAPPASMDVYRQHVDAGLGVTRAPSLDPYYAMMQACNLVLDGLSR
jgi:hypothetical protein